MTGGSTPSGFVVNAPGANPVNTSAGVATFTNVAVRKVGTAYQLRANGTFNSTPLTQGTSSAFNITPGALDKLYFAADALVTPTFPGGQPIDTAKVSAKIYSACAAAPVGSVRPCLSTSTPVKVLAVDAWENRKPGVTVSIVNNPNISFSGNTPVTTSTSPTQLGEAWFSNLSIGFISSIQTDKYTLVASSGAKSVTSASFRIVSDLANCVGQSKCTNTTTNNSITTPENSFSISKVTLGGTFGQVVETTNFTDGSDVNGKCGANTTLANAVDVRVIGDNVQITKPTTTMFVIIKSKTLQFTTASAPGTPQPSMSASAPSISTRGPWCHGPARTRRTRRRPQSQLQMRTT